MIDTAEINKIQESVHLVYTHITVQQACFQRTQEISNSEEDLGLEYWIGHMIGMRQCS